MSDLPDILICRCAVGRALPQDRVRHVEDALRAAGLAFESVPDLCELAARCDPALAAWTRRPGLRIVACHPRAIAGLLDLAGLTPPPGSAILNLHETPAAEVAQALGAPSIIEGPAPSSAAGEPGVTEDCVPSAGGETAAGDAWFPWFPVIDRARCTACRQCADFCLFGVYTFENGRIDVRNPSGCKPHCPACARICPRSAIVFPKHDEAPINGAPVTDEEAEAARIRKDLHELLGDDLDAALAERKRRALARRLLDPEKVRLAKAERARHAAREGRP